MSLIPGVELELGGEKRILAPLNAAAIKQHRDKIGQVFVGQVPDVELVSLLAYCSLKRNYPDVTQDQVDDWIDYGNLIAVWEAVMNISGLAVEPGKMERRVREAMQATGLPTP